MPAYSGLWNNEYGENYSLLGNPAKEGNSQTQLARLFSNRIYSRGVDRQLLISLIGAAPGANATSTHKRVKAERDLNSNVQGGDRTIETFSGVNRNTTSGDVTLYEGALALQPAPSYPVDKSGNGGGNKLGW